VAQQLAFQIGPPAVRIDQHAIFAARHRVDGQIAADQVFFERDIGAGVKDETGIAWRRLAFGAGEGVFLMRLRMQEDREVAADGFEPSCRHVFRGGADDDPVAILYRQAEQFVAHRAADAVGLHVQ